VVQHVPANAEITAHVPAGPRIPDLHPPAALPAADQPLEQSCAFAGGAAASPRRITFARNRSRVARYLQQGLFAGEQITPNAPWRIRLTDEVRARFVPHVPHGFVALNDAARLLGCACQTVLHEVQRGELRAIQVTNGRRKGLSGDSRTRSRRRFVRATAQRGWVRHFD
jgi:hypothetical protein